jgi:hypothetical protein
VVLPAERRAEAAALFTGGEDGSRLARLYEGGDGSPGEIETNRYACVMGGSGG